MVDVQAAAAAAGLAAPAGARQDDLPDGLPLFWRSRRPAARSRLVRLPPTSGRSAERLTPDHQPGSRHGFAQVGKHAEVSPEVFAHVGNATVAP